MRSTLVLLFAAVVAGCGSPNVDTTNNLGTTESATQPSRQPPR